MVFGLAPKARQVDDGQGIDLRRQLVAYGGGFGPGKIGEDHDRDVAPIVMLERRLETLPGAAVPAVGLTAGKSKIPPRAAGQGWTVQLFAQMSPRRTRSSKVVKQSELSSRGRPHI